MAVPIPCSALIEPCSAATSSNTAPVTSSASSGTPVTLTCTLPSPAWPNIQTDASGASSAHARGHVVDELGETVGGQRDVELERRAEQVDRLGVRPRGNARARAAAAASVATATSATARATPDGACERVGGIGVGRGFDEHVGDVIGGERSGESEPVAHELETRRRKNSSIALTQSSSRRRSPTASSAASTSSNAHNAFTAWRVGARRRNRAAVTTASVPSLPHTSPARS